MDDSPVLIAAEKRRRRDRKSGLAGWILFLSVIVGITLLVVAVPFAIFIWQWMQIRC